ncbi:MAG: FRG domain-containing protein [Eubacterium sp.]|nr:FRG domain-containing protein [Eubacterium sp.]
MVTKIEITSMDDLYAIIMEQDYRDDLKRHRSKYLYRGLSNSNYKLVTSLSRICKSEQVKIENALLNNFYKYAVKETNAMAQSEWSRMVIGQHHGLPTRLMDWSYSPLVGLHFATSGIDLDGLGKTNAALWKIDIEELNQLLPAKYKHALCQNHAHLFTVSMLESLKIDLATYDKDMKKSSLLLLEPLSMDQRIINQYSFFLAIPNGISNVEKFLDEKTNNSVKYIIHADLCWQIRDFLDHINISERMIYPGLDGIAQWLKRRYYHRG